MASRAFAARRTTTSSSSSSSSSSSRSSGVKATSTLIRNIVKGTGATIGLGTVGCISYGYYLYQTDVGTKRAITAYTTFLPVVLHYRLYEFLSNHKLYTLTEKDWYQLDIKYAKSTCDKLGELQGMYCKYGQTAAGFTNTFSDVWINELRKLENEVPPRDDIDTIYETITKEMNIKSIYDIFDTFDTIPLGSASIGQVHRATLKKGDGHHRREVAVKVQYNDAYDLFHNDIQTIRTFCELVAPENVVLLNALEKSNIGELDYTNELQNLQEITYNMTKKHNMMPNEIVIPRPLKEYTTKRMLTMELLPGPKLIDGINSYFEYYAQQNGTTLHHLQQEARDKIEKEGIPPKYDGPSSTQIYYYRNYLKVKDMIMNVGIACYNGIVGNLARGNTIHYQHSVLPPNIPRIVDVLMRVHGYQLLKDGVFNSDPHGGNFLLLPDGRIGCIDYGATKRFTRNERLAICLLFAALSRNDEDMLYDMCQVSGYKSKYGNHDVLMKLIQFGYNTWSKEIMGNKNIQQFIDDLKHQDPWYVLSVCLSSHLFNSRTRPLSFCACLFGLYSYPSSFFVVTPSYLCVSYLQGRSTRQFRHGTGKFM